MGLISETRGFVLPGSDEIPSLDGLPMYVTDVEPRLVHMFYEGKWGGYTALEMLDDSSASLPTSFGLFFVASDLFDYPESHRMYVLRNGRLHEVDVRQVAYEGYRSPDLKACFDWLYVASFLHQKSAEERADWLNSWMKRDGGLRSIIGETSVVWGVVQLVEDRDSGPFDDEATSVLVGESTYFRAAHWLSGTAVVFHGTTAGLPSIESTLTKILDSNAFAIGMVLALDSEDSIRAFGCTSKAIVELSTLNPSRWKYYRDLEFFVGYRPRKGKRFLGPSSSVEVADVER